jgi:hypothetical protein
MKSSFSSKKYSKRRRRKRDEVIWSRINRLSLSTLLGWVLCESSDGYIEENREADRSIEKRANETSQAKAKERQKIQANSIS